jgi:hypothetical protein
MSSIDSPLLVLLLCLFLCEFSVGFLWLQVTLLSISSSSNLNMVTKTENLDYFAIGSMMHPVSIANRGIHPISSEPAELLDHRIGFFTSQGYAEAIPENGSSFHGVIHHLTDDDMRKLDKIEQLYDRRTATARLYDGTTRTVTVYIQSDIEKEKGMENGLPNERYLEIMMDGCKHYGVDPKYIEFLESHETVPRLTPDQYLSFDSVEDCDRTMSIEEVIENDGSDGKPLYFAVNGKVIEVAHDRDSKMFTDFYHMFKNMGQIGELFIAKVVYEPRFGVPDCLEDFTPEHAAYCEHEHAAYINMTEGGLQNWKVIAKLAPKNTRNSNN